METRVVQTARGDNAFLPAAIEDRWLPTVCTTCDGSCLIQVQVKSGTATAIRGQPGVPPNYGKMCAKGKSALAELYNPLRIAAPLRRTNPEKGLGVDPKWKKITWQEALDILTARLKELRERNPQGLSLNTFDYPFGTVVFSGAFGAAFGGSKYRGAIPQASGLFCGNGIHPISYTINGSDDHQPDLTQAQYLLVLGGGYGAGSGHHSISLAQDLASARVTRGLKMVVVDPCRGNAASRADEWVPILPGTDSALCLAMANVIVNELGLYDKEFLLSYTNAPYLVRANGHYVRDDKTGKPLVLSISQGRAVPYDSTASVDLVLEGKDLIKGEEVHTAFVLLKEHLKYYTPERAAQITTVSASTIKRIAGEFATASRIGSTTTIDGVTVPHRPACAIWYRGLSQHQHGLVNGWAVALLNLIVGSLDVPGGLSHSGSTGAWGLPDSGQDGLMVATNPFISMKTVIPLQPAYFDPSDPDLLGLFPLASYSTTMGALTLKSPEKHKINYELEVWISARTNPMKSSGDPKETAEILKKIPFQISFARQHDETTQFADIVLPDTHHLERLVPFAHTPGTHFFHSPMPDEKEWVCAVQQPVVKPMGEARNWYEVLWDLAHRAGFAGDLYSALNALLKLDPQHEMKRDKTYSFDEFCDRWMRSWCGEEHDLRYFRDHGWVLWAAEREMKHRYPRIFHQGRIPVYLEHWLTAGESVKEVVEETGLDWGDTSDYESLPRYRACWAAGEGGEAFSFYLVNPKVSFLSLSTGAIKNVHLQEIAAATGQVFAAGIHPSAASALGISNGDDMELEAPSGKTVVVKARVTKDVHPKVISAAGNVAKVLSVDGKVELGRGIHLNEFIPYRMERVDMLSAALDACVKVRVRKVPEKNVLSKLKNKFFKTQT